jgi:hypothetical protein
VTVTSALAADSAGDVATQLVDDWQSTAPPAVCPKLTEVEPTTKPVPVMVTTVPPASGPALGEIPVTMLAAS